jgi:hypothetical protein
MNPSHRRLTLVAVTLLFVLTTADNVSAQWSFWSPGTACISGDIIRLDGIGTMSSPSPNTLVASCGPAAGSCFLVIGLT